MSAVQGQSFTLMFVAVDVNAQTTRQPTITWASGDVMITKPGGTPTASTNLPTHRGGGRWQLDITAAETGLGLTDGQVGEFLVDMTNAAMIPILGLAVEVAYNGPGTLTAAAQSSLVAAIGAVPSAATVAAAVDAILVDNFAAVLGAVAALPAAPSSGAIASAVDAILADNFTALPSATAVRDAVWAQVSDGSPVLQRLTAAIALLLNKAQLPGEAGGPIIVRDAADDKDRIVAAITAEGARTVTTVDGT